MGDLSCLQHIDLIKKYHRKELLIEVTSFCLFNMVRLSMIAFSIRK